MRGESNTKTSRKLADLFEAEKYHATTLVRTETAHIHAKADLKAYKRIIHQNMREIIRLNSIMYEIYRERA